MKEKSWLYTTATKNLVFQPNTEDIWKNAVTLLGEAYKPIINYPTNPSFN
jgi:putative AlgH/UPF0301 family transcriptional regulator